MKEACVKLNMHWNTFKKYAVEFGCFKPNQSHKGMKIGWKITRYKTEDILAGLHPTYSPYKLKNRLIEEGYKERKCECCGRTEWNGQPIPLELHHKDGNSYNHSLENLQILCLNCHA